MYFLNWWSDKFLHVFTPHKHTYAIFASLARKFWIWHNNLGIHPFNKTEGSRQNQVNKCSARHGLRIASPAGGMLFSPNSCPTMWLSLYLCHIFFYFFLLHKVHTLSKLFLSTFYCKTFLLFLLKIILGENDYAA